MSSDSFDLTPLLDRAAALVEAAGNAGADASDAVVAASRARGVEVRNGKVDEIEASENNAFSLRVFVGKRAASVSANQSGDVNALAERAVAMARVAPENEYAGLAPQDLLANEVADLDLYDPAEPAIGQLEEMARTCEDAALAVEGVTKSSGASCSFGLGGTVLATSHGFAGAYRASRFSLSVAAVAGEGTAMQRDYDFDSRRHFEDLRDPAEIGTRAGERSVRRLNPRTLPSGPVTVLFEPRMARSLVSHIASALNGSSVLRKTSFLRDRMGDQALSEAITLIDKPAIRRASASRPFDGEGLAPEDLALVERGTVTNWTLDGATARELGLPLNARASRAGSGTSPTTTNLELTAGTDTPEAMIAGIKHGLLVTELIGQGVNMVTGDYSRGASGFLIENGELGPAVSEITIAGNLKDMFRAMTPASDMDVNGAIRTPSILVEGMTLAGR